MGAVITANLRARGEEKNAFSCKDALLKTK
jgi:hypothetical protein